jgi:hypothetical protein
MPQPFLRVAPPGSNIVLHSAEESIFPKTPELSLLALSAISSWSKVELSLLRVFVQLMGGAESLSAAIYVSLETQSAKNAAINAAAQHALKERQEEHQLLRAVLSISKTNQKFRDKLAHWVWGYSQGVPDVLLLADPRGNYGGVHKKDVLVFKAIDFEQAILANQRLETYCWQLDFVIAVQTSTPKRNSIFNRLATAPEVADAMRRLAKKADET